jgi:hypothetical protein
MNKPGSDEGYREMCYWGDANGRLSVAQLKWAEGVIDEHCPPHKRAEVRRWVRTRSRSQVAQLFKRWGVAMPESVELSKREI